MAVSHPQSFAAQTGYRPPVKLPVTQQPGPITRTVQSLSQQAETTPDMPLGRRIAGGITRGVVNTLGFIPETAEAIAQGDNPGDALRAVYDRTVAPQVNEYRTAKREAEQGNTSQSMGHSIAAAIPFAGPLAAGIGERAGTGDVAGATVEGLTYALAPKAIETVKSAPFEAPSTQGSLVPPPLQAMGSTALDASRRVGNRVAGTGRYADLVDEPVQGSSYTKRDVYEAAKDNGVNLDLQQATGAPLPTVIKHGTESSIAGSGPIRANDARNIVAVQSWLDRLRNQMGFSDGTASKEQVGNAGKAALQQHQQGLESQAQDGFDQLTKEVGNSQPDTSSIQAEAKKIVGDFSDYYEKHPELLPKRAWSILDNLANGVKSEASHSHGGALPAVDTSAWDGTAPKEPPPDTWSDLQRLRSDLMNEYRSNPQIVGTQAEGWLKQMVGHIDDVMTDTATTLTPEQAATFREANDTWRQMKKTYDDPQSPLYSVVRANTGMQAASTLSRLDPQYLRMISEASPETARNLRQTILDDVLDPKATGVLDPRNITKRLKNLERLGGLFTPEELHQIAMLGRVSDAVNQNLNPSGSGTRMIGWDSLVAPATALFSGHPLAAVGIPAMTRILANRSINPEVVGRAIRRGSRASRISVEPSSVPPPDSLPRAASSGALRQASGAESPVRTGGRQRTIKRTVAHRD
jgi:hypothetical protein